MKTFLPRTTFASTLITASLASSFLTSCQDEDFGYSADQIKYEKSFTKIYGEIPEGKSWDMSSFTNLYDPYKDYGTETRGGSGFDISRQITVGNHYDVKDWWEVPSQTLNWMKSALKEGKDNRYLGSNFVLQLPENDFVIIFLFSRATHPLTLSWSLKSMVMKSSAFGVRMKIFLSMIIS